MFSIVFVRITCKNDKSLYIQYVTQNKCSTNETGVMSIKQPCERNLKIRLKSSIIKLTIKL